MNNENDLELRCDNIEAAAAEALNRVYDIQQTLNELNNQIGDLKYNFDIHNRCEEEIGNIIKIMVNKLISVIREGDFDSLDDEEFARELTNLFYDESGFFPF